jgi:thioredoxin-like negative regulator of GroEL
MPSQPLRRTCATVRACCDQLRQLMDQLADNPLDESTSLALVAHVVTNRDAAAHLLETLETRRAAC